MTQKTKRYEDLIGNAIAQAFCRSVSKKEQLRREANLKAQKNTPFTPVFRFAVASDIHLSADDPTPADRLRKLFAAAYTYSAAHPTYRALDAVALVGDFTDRGSQAEYDILRSILDAELKDGTHLFTVMGNHEHADLDTEGYRKNLDDRLDKHETLGGYHFLGIAPLPTDTWHLPRQILWMAKELRSAAKADPARPIFTFQHGHIWKTVYVSRSWYTQMGLPLHLVYARYPRIINFSGHSHGPINHPLTVWQSRYTMFGTGTLRYFEMERDLSTDVTPEGCGEAAQFLLVEVDAQNRVRVLPYNLITGDFFKTTATTGDPEEQLVYFIENPGDRRTYPYTAARKKTDAAPRFAPEAKITVSEVTAESATVTFDAAQSDVCVYGYRVKVYDKEHPCRPVAVRTLYSNYFFEPMPVERSCVLDGLRGGTDYTVRIFPVNVWLKQGKPVGTAFTTAKR